MSGAGGRQATSGQYGNVSIPQEAFIAALRMGEE
jgi:translation elongation factor EF-4